MGFTEKLAFYQQQAIDKARHVEENFKKIHEAAQRYKGPPIGSSKFRPLNQKQETDARVDDILEINGGDYALHHYEPMSKWRKV